MPKRLSDEERELKRKERNRNVFAKYQTHKGAKGNAAKWKQAAEIFLRQITASDTKIALRALDMNALPDSLEDLTKIWKNKMRKAHPDKGGSTAQAKEINRAYSVLKTQYAISTQEITVKSISLYFCQGSSDKEYHIQLIKTGEAYIVNFQFGRRGSTLQTGTKTSSPVSLQQAEKIYNALLKSKTAKGYQEGEVKNNFSGKVPKKATTILPQLLNPIENVEDYISDVSYIAQEKKDGERRLIIAADTVIGINRKGGQVELPKAIIESIKGKYTLDGEIIGDAYYVFDILSLNGKCLKNTSCVERLKILNSLSFGQCISIVETAHNTAEKKRLLKNLKDNNKEGIVFKKADSIYQEGRPAVGGDHLKYKFYKTATFIVANHTEGKRSVGLELIDGNKKVFMGKVTIPPNHNVPEIGDIIECRYLYAYKGGAVYQPTYLGVRKDMCSEDATLDQIVYKED